MPRFTTSSTTYGALYARPQVPSAGVKIPTVAIDNPYANSLAGIDAVLADRGGSRWAQMSEDGMRREKTGADERRRHEAGADGRR